MILRSAGLLASLTLATVAAENRLAAQPIVPNRPRSSAFQSLFYPGSQAIPNAGFGPGYGPQIINRGLGGITGNAPVGQQFGIAGSRMPTPSTQATMAQPVVFNNFGHWYSGYYGHWYPDGIASGLGVLREGGMSAGTVRGGPIMSRTPILAAGTGLGVGVGVPLGGIGPRAAPLGR